MGEGEIEFWPASECGPSLPGCAFGKSEKSSLVPICAVSLLGTLVGKSLARPPDRKFQQCFRRFRANLDFGKFRPLAALIYPQHRSGRDLTQGKAPTYR
jgi:hypothetical protein